jgi:predicted RNA-binding protein with RPS1 domain
LQFRHTNSKGNGEDKSDKLTIYLSIDGLEDHAEASAGKRKRKEVETTSSTTQDNWNPMTQLFGKNAIKLNGLYAGCVVKMEETSCIVALSPYISSRLHYLDVSSDEDVVKMFIQKGFIGQKLVVQASSFTFDPAEKNKSKPKGVKVSRVSGEKYLAVTKPILTLTTASAKAISDGASTSDSLKQGSLVLGMLDLQQQGRRRVARPPAILVSLAGGLVGRVCLSELSELSDWKDCAYLMGAPSSSSSSKGTKGANPLQLPDGKKHGNLVQCRVLSVPSGSSGSGDVVELSLRPSRVACKVKKDSVLPDPIPAEGSLVKAFVSNCSAQGKGCFLRLTHGITGQVLMKDLSDDFVTDPHLLYPMGKLVTARLLSVSQTEGNAKLSMKGSAVLGDQQADDDIKSIQVKSTIEGTVQRVSPIGVFIAIKGTSLVGLSRRSAACEDSEDLAEMYKVGAFVRAKVLSVAKVSKKIALGLKASFFVKEDKHGKDADDSDEREEEEEDVEDEEEEEEEEDDDDEEEEDSDDDEGVDADDDDESCLEMLDQDDDGSDAEMDAMIKAASVRAIEEEEDEKPKVTKKQKKEKASKKVVPEPIEEEEEESDDDAGPSIFATKSLKASSKSSMQWADFKPVETAAFKASTKKEDDDSEDSEEEEQEEKGGKGTRTRQKEAVKRREEQAIRERETLLEQGTLVPERPEDFERLLLAEPCSSLLWVKFMSHYLLQADLDATRSIAERALRTIGFKEEEEKFNVWIAYINMEHKYGDMASLDSVFKRAIAESKGKMIHLNLAEAYEAADDKVGTAAIYEKAVKKYKGSAYQHFKLRAGDSDGAKGLLSRSMQSLSRHKHIEVLIK